MDDTTFFSGQTLEVEICQFYQRYQGHQGFDFMRLSKEEKDLIIIDVLKKVVINQKSYPLRLLHSKEEIHEIIHGEEDAETLRVSILFKKRLRRKFAKQIMHENLLFRFQPKSKFFENDESEDSCSTQDTFKGTHRRKDSEYITPHSSSDLDLSIPIGTFHKGSILTGTLSSNLSLKNLQLKEELQKMKERYVEELSSKEDNEMKLEKEIHDLKSDLQTRDQMINDLASKNEKLETDIQELYIEFKQKEQEQKKEIDELRQSLTSRDTLFQEAFERLSAQLNRKMETKDRIKIEEEEEEEEEEEQRQGHGNGSNSLQVCSSVQIVDPQLAGELVKLDKYDDFWIPGVIMNSYLKTLRRAESIYICTTDAFSFVSNTKRFQIDEMRKKYLKFTSSLVSTVEWVFFPVNYPQKHWALIIYHLKTRQFFSMDSFQLNFLEEMEGHAILINIIHSIHGQCNYHYKFHQVLVPRQMNHFDCGVHVLCMIEMLALDLGRLNSLLSFYGFINWTDWFPTLNFGKSMRKKIFDTLNKKF